MKKIKMILLVLIGVLVSFIAKSEQVTISEESISFEVCSHYKYRVDNKAGREVIMSYNGVKDIVNAKLEIETRVGTEQKLLKSERKDKISILLPPDIGVAQDDTVVAHLIIGKDKISKRFIVPAMRHWTIYIYPHSHVDIGYTNTQANVEIIHKRNLEVAMELAEKTRNYPEGSRFLWNPEVTWPIERYMSGASQKNRDRLLTAIKDGSITVDAGYVSTNTSASNDEELFELFRYAKYLEKESGRSVKTMVQVDIPGMSWGIVPTAQQLGISYCMSLFNGFDRVGSSHELNFRPFWWLGPDGKSKVLFLQPGAYTPGAHAKGKYFWPSLAGQTDTTKLMRLIKTDNPRENFIDAYIAEMLPKLENTDHYIYDIFPMTWCMADNTPIDTDLPDAVKSWNEEFAYPRLRISGATEIMEVFDKKYGDQLPTYSGDFTEYWTDGLGSSAHYTGKSREVKEKLTQAETLWSMLKNGTPAPRKEINEAWRNVILGTEHTWAYMAPDQQPISDNILKVKHGYFDTAERMTNEIMNHSLDGVTKKGSSTIAVFNTNSWSSSGIITLSHEDSKGYNSVVDRKGNKALSQRLSTGQLAFQATNIPALGCKNYTLKKGQSKQANSFVKGGNVLDNGLVKVTIDPATGDVASLMYKEYEYVDQKAPCTLNSYRYLRGEDPSERASKAYDIEITIKENGPLISSLLVKSNAEGCNSLEREVRITANSPSVDFTNIVDKIAIKNKEGVHFGFAFNLPKGVTNVNVPWGVMQLEKDQLPEGNRNWIALQRWLNISNDKRGVTWCSLNASIFESGDITANILGGAFGHPSWIRKIEPSSTIYSWALNNHWHTNFRLSQGGKIKFEYRVLPHDDAYDAGVSNRFGVEQIRPLISVPVDKRFKMADRLLIDGGSKNITLSVYKTINSGKSNILRISSVSQKDEVIKIGWEKRLPKVISYCKMGEDGSNHVVENGIVKIPAMGFVTLRVDWE